MPLTTSYRIVGGPQIQVGDDLLGYGQEFTAEELNDPHLLRLLLASGQVVEYGYVEAFEPSEPDEPDADEDDDPSDSDHGSEG